MNTSTNDHEYNLDGLPTMSAGEVDDLGLSPYEYRAYGHVLRCAALTRSGTYWESLPNGAAHCNMALRTYRKAIASLVDKGLLERRDRKGGTSVLSVNPTHKWRTQPTEQAQR